MLYSIIFQLNNLPFEYKVIIFLTYTFAVILALTMHEFAHAFVAHKLGDDTAKNQGRLTINPMAHFDITGLLCFMFLGFGWAKPVPINSYNFRKIKRDTFLVSVAGITINFILAFIFCPLSILAMSKAADSMLIYTLYCLCTYIFNVNLVFMVFNLLPIYPLDGFNMIASQAKYDNAFVNFMQKYSYVILLIVVCVFSFTNLFEYLVYYVGYPISWFWNLIV